MNLEQYDKADYQPGNLLKRIVWLFVSRLFFETFLPWPSTYKSFLLRLFGAKIGKSVVIKPSVKIKYPWFLTIAENSWIGEKVWIDNLSLVSIGQNCCISQEVYILTGSHDYKLSSFKLITKKVEIEDAVWLGAKSIVAPGVKIGKTAVLSLGSVATNDLEQAGIYQGNPAKLIRKRIIVNVKD